MLDPLPPVVEEPDDVPLLPDNVPLLPDNVPLLPDDEPLLPDDEPMLLDSVEEDEELPLDEPEFSLLVGDALLPLLDVWEFCEFVAEEKSTATGSKVEPPFVPER